MKIMDVIAAVFLVIGAQIAFGTLVYVLAGLAALYQAAALRSIQRRWGVRTA